MIRVVETKPHPIAGDDTVFTFIGDDGKGYEASFSGPARAQLLVLLQVEIARRLETDAIPLTLTSCSVLAAAQGFALAVETKEAGPIAFRVSPEVRVQLRERLVELDTFAEPQQKM